MWNDLDDFISPSEESLRILLKEKGNQISDLKIMLKEKDNKIGKLIEEKTELKMHLQESKKDIKRDVKPKDTGKNSAVETA
jgi:hypothetical protein